ncbi:MAG: ABC-2 transporter permease [Candidatus Marinimicrobia bacterium]|nr:ABC-2 transporter permease [Candidatus Neomarinimicrobiota bacterium]
MQATWIIWRREIRAYLVAPAAYAIWFFFLVVLGYSFSIQARLMAQGDAVAPMVRHIFSSLFFWMAMLIGTPLLTMRLLAEERQAGTDEALMTAPVPEYAIILGKYLATLCFFGLLWLPTLLYGPILRYFDPNLPPAMATALSGYLGAFLIGSAYLAIGLWASTVSRTQLAAAMLCFTFLCSLFFTGLLPFILRSGWWRDVAAYVSATRHMLDFSSGTIDSRPLVFYPTLTALALFAAWLSLAARRGR